MRIAANSEKDRKTLRQLAESVDRCNSGEACETCSGIRWHYDPVQSEEQGEIVLRRAVCPKRAQEDRSYSLKRMIEKSGVPPDTTPVRPSAPTEGLIVVCPRRKTSDMSTELTIRRAADGITLSYMLDNEMPALRVQYLSLALGGDWHDGYKRWQAAALTEFVGWNCRGLSENLAVAFNNALIERLSHDRPTIVTCSADPALLSPAYESDEPVLDALRHPDLIIRADGEFLRQER